MYRTKTNKTNMCNRMLQAYILGFMEIKVYKIQPVGGWGKTISIPGPNSCSIKKKTHNLLHMCIKSCLKTHAQPSSETRHLNFSMCGYPSPYVLCKQESLNQECSGSVVECLTRDRGAAGSSFTSITALCP